MGEKMEQRLALPRRGLYGSGNAGVAQQVVTRPTVTKDVTRNTVTASAVTPVTPVTVEDVTLLQQRVTDMEIKLEQVMARLTVIEGLSPKAARVPAGKAGSRAAYMRARRAKQNAAGEMTENPIGAVVNSTGSSTD